MSPMMPMQAETSVLVNRGLEASAEAHHLPCGVVGYSGRVKNLRNFFKPTMMQEDACAGDGNDKGKGNDGHATVKRSEVSLRGRRLVGEEVAMPEGFELAVIRREGAVNADGSGAADGAGYALAARVSAMYRYNHDMPPSATDGMARAMQYIGMAEALHGKVRRSNMRSPHQDPYIDISIITAACSSTLRIHTYIHAVIQQG